MKLLPVVVVLLAPLLTSCKKRPRDCSEILANDKNAQTGTYTIFPTGEYSNVQVKCDMDGQGGGWTVFHNRDDGMVGFYRNYKEYQKGFGDILSGYWLGLDPLHALVNGRPSELYINMGDFEGNTAFARYKSFSIGPSSDGYKLSVSGFINGGAGDALSYHNGQKFSAWDNDQDSSKMNCARKYMGGFWYNDCYQANPNGVYLWGPAADNYYGVGLAWKPWRGRRYSLKCMYMMVRPLK